MRSILGQYSYYSVTIVTVLMADIQGVKEKTSQLTITDTVSVYEHHITSCDPLYRLY